MRPTDAAPHPSDWKTTTVRAAIEIKRGISWSKEQEHSAPRDGAYPVIRIGNVQDTLELDDLLYISNLKPKAAERKRVAAGWSILVGSNGNRERIGNSVLIDTDVDFLFASFLIAAKPLAESEIDPRYFSWWLRTQQVQAYLTASAEGSTGLCNLSRSFFESMPIAYPLIGDQAAIAGALDIVDRVLIQANSLISCASAARAALMDAAFRYEFAAEAKADSEAGRIPVSWQAIKGRDAFTVLTGGNSSVFALAPLRDGEIADAWFMKVGDFNLPSNTRRVVTTQISFVEHKNPTFKLLPAGTLVIAKRGAAIFKNRVRTTAIPVALDPNLMALQVSEGILPEFFRYQLEWRNLTRYVESSGVPQLNNKDLYPRWFVRAPEVQQKEIVEVISAAEKYEDALLAKLAALEALKQSLMHDLLTGQVRVDPTLFAA